MPEVLIVPPACEPITLAQAKLHLHAPSANTEDDLISALIAAARKHAETFTRRVIIGQTRKLVLDGFPSLIKLPTSPLRSVSSIQYVDTAGALQTLDPAHYRVDKDSDEPRIQPAYGEVWPTTRDVIGAVSITYVCGYLLPVVADAAADTLTFAGHGYVAGDVAQIAALGAGLPTGLVAGTNYFVVNPTANTLQLAAAAGGAAIDITNAGTVPNVIGAPKELEALLAGVKLLLGHLFEHRETVADFELFEMPVAAEHLLRPYAVWRF
jgi:uncharacterized phiE125 gp8 family phage protein